MLVLSRKLEEALVIGDITVRVLGIEHGRVKLGISAPRAIDVWREEALNAADPRSRLAEKDGATP